MRATRLLILIALVFPHIAHSALNSADLIDPAGTVIAGGVTQDSNTGLEWVDLTVTQGNIAGALSVEDVLAGGGPGIGWVNDGWRIATPAEVCLLFSTYVGTAPTCPDGGFGVVATPEDSMAFMAFFGITDQTQLWSRGLFDDGSAGSSGIAVLEFTGFVNIASNARPSNTPWLDAGIFLVRPVVSTGEQQIEVTPLTINFGDVELFDIQSRPLTLTNVGSSSLTVFSDPPIIPEDSGFALNGLVGTPENPPPLVFPRAPLVIPPGESITPFSSFGGIVLFSPVVAGPAMATLQIQSDDPDNPVVNVMLIGNGVLTSPLCSGMQATIVGTADADVLWGTSGDDVIVGMSGDDFIFGRGGNDTICGGDGNDAISGNGGDDTLLGESGNDTLKGGNGFDLLIGGGGRDVLVGDSGNDVLRGNGGNDRLFGGGGDDNLRGGAGDDVLFGEGGDDTLDGRNGVDICDVSSDSTFPLNCELDNAS